MRKRVGVLGANGLLGTDLVYFLSSDFDITPITRESYEKHRGEKFDFLINANGNSKRFWANQNPQEDFFASTVSVVKSIFDFPSDLYIYISSPDVYENHTRSQYAKESKKIEPENLQPYGFNKYLGELIIKKYKEKFLILRLSMILGTKMKKGPFYDILSHNPIFVTFDSKLQLMTTNAIAKIIKTLIARAVVCETLNVGGEGSFAFTKIRKYFNKEIQVSPEAETQIYEMNVEKVKRFYPNLKTSEEYLQEFLSDYQK